MNMNRIGVIAIILTLLPAKMLAQTEGNNGVLPGGNSATSPYAPNDIMQSDTLKLHLDHISFYFVIVRRCKDNHFLPMGQIIHEIFAHLPFILYLFPRKT